MSDSIEKIECDIFIIGGGIAGCIAAIALSEYAGVVLIDKRLEPEDKIGESLAPAAKRILKKLGIYEELNLDENDVHLVNRAAKSYWGSSKARYVDHLNNPDGYGWYLNRKSFEKALRLSVENRGVRCLWGAQFKSNSRDQNSNTSILSQSSKTIELKSKFIIDASGRSAHFARSLSIKREIQDKLVAYWATTENNALHHVSQIIAVESGWWYISPIPQNKIIISFYSDADLIESLIRQKRNREGFIELIEEHDLASKLGALNYSSLSFKGVVSANTSRLTKYADDYWAAIGDAVIHFDPLSSQGMFNAMASAMQLTDLLKQFRFTEANGHFDGESFTKIYSQQIDSIWNHYVGHKKHYYSMEQRWNQAPFWARRI